MNKKEFLKKHGLTEDQFASKEKIVGDLDLRSVTQLPEGFNPTVGGDLYLGSVTQLPEGFNPTVGGYLYLGSVTQLPEGFNPTVGGDLYLGSVTQLPEGFKKSDYERKKVFIERPNSFIKWVRDGKEYIKCDGRFSEVISKKGGVWKLKDMNKNNEYYLVTDNKGKYAHGNTIKEAKEDLVYKISNRDKSQYNGMELDKKLSFEKCIEMYRVITGSCATGVRNFIESKNVPKKSLTINEVAKITNGSYGSEEFKRFFSLKTIQ